MLCCLLLLLHHPSLPPCSFVTYSGNLPSFYLSSFKVYHPKTGTGVHITSTGGFSSEVEAATLSPLYFSPHKFDRKKKNRSQTKKELRIGAGAAESLCHVRPLHPSSYSAHKQNMFCAWKVFWFGRRTMLPCVRLHAFVCVFACVCVRVCVSVPPLQDSEVEAHDSPLAFHRSEL